MTGGILFFTHDDGAASRLLADALADSPGLAGIVLESRWPSRVKRRLRRIVGEGLFRRFLGLFLLLRHGRLERRLRALEDALKAEAERELLEGVGRPRLGWPAGVPIHHTDDANCDATATWCRSFDPDLFVLCAMPILGQSVLSLPRRGVLNVHLSLLPDYRGPWPEFWQVLNGDTAAAGVTIHIATDHPDCGDVILQKASATSPGLDPYRLRTRNVLVAREVLPAAVRSFLMKTAVPRRQGPPKTPPHRVRDRTQAKRVELLGKMGHTL